MPPQNGNRPGKGAAHSVGIPSSATEPTCPPARAQAELTARPTFILRIEFAGKAEFAIHGLRKLLKSLILTHHFRVRSIEQIEGLQ